MAKLPTYNSVFERISEDAVRLHEDNIRKWLNERKNHGTRRRFWGRGVRPHAMSRKHLLEGLKRAGQANPGLFVRFGNRPLFSLIEAALIWWSYRDSDTALEFLATMYQPRLEHITFVRGREDFWPTDSFGASLTTIHDQHVVDGRLRFPYEEANQVQNLVFSSLDWLALELIGLQRGETGQEELEQLWAGEPVRAAEVARDQRRFAPLALIIAGDYDAAVAVISPEDEISSILKRAAELVRAAARSEWLEVQHLIGVVRAEFKDSPVLTGWPTWRLFEGWSAYHVDGHLAAAEIFASARDPRRYSPLPLLLAASCLEDAGIELAWESEDLKAGQAQAKLQKRIEGVIREAFGSSRRVVADVGPEPAEKPAQESKRQGAINSAGSALLDKQEKVFELFFQSISDYRALRSQLDEAWKARDLTALNELTGECEEIGLVARARELEIPVPKKKEDTFRAEELDTFEKSAANTLESLRAQIVENMQERKEDLLRAAKGVGTDLIERIEAVEHSDDLRELEKEIVWRTSVKAGESSGFREFAPSHRLAFYTYLFGQPVDADFLGAVEDDPIWKDNESLRGLDEHFASFIRRQLERSVAMAPSVWRIASRVASGDATAWLEKHDLPELLLDADEESIAIGELSEFLGTDVAGDLQRLAICGAAANRPAQERVEIFGSLAQEFPQRSYILAKLSEALRDGGDRRSAILVIQLGILSGLELLADFEIAELVLEELIEGRGENRLAEFARHLHFDLSWLEPNPRNLAATLVTAAFFAHEEPVNFWRYQHREIQREFDETYPTLSYALKQLNPNTNGGLSSEQVVARWHAARDAWISYEEASKRRSCYSNWSYAEKYQDYFRDHLERLRESGGSSLDGLEVHEIIELAKDEKELPEVEGRAKPNMSKFLEDQLARLRVLKDASQIRPNGGSPLFKKTKEIELEMSKLLDGESSLDNCLARALREALL